MKYHVETLLKGIGASFLSDVTPEAVGRNPTERRAKGLGVQTSNHYTEDAKAFLNWLVRAKRATENPLRNLTKQQLTANARKHVRRALERSEAATLLQETLDGPERCGMSGQERHWLYRLALETGLHSSELRALTRASFRLDVPEPMVWLPGDAAKNRGPAELPLRPDTVTELREFLRSKAPSAPLFPTMPNVTDVARMLRHDLDAAGIKQAATRAWSIFTPCGPRACRGWRRRACQCARCRRSPGTRRPC